MIRFLLFLFGKTGYEPCKSCETLKAQLEFVNHEKRELAETLLRLVKPEVIHTAPPVLKNPVAQARTFTEHRKILENMNARKRDIISNSPFIASSAKVADSSEANKETAGKQQSVESLEAELAIGGE